MTDLVDYVRQYDHSKWFGRLFTNAIRFSYTAILSAVVDGADTLVIGLTGFKWFMGNDFIGSYLDGNVIVPEPTFNILIDEILKHDEVLRDHLVITRKTITETTVRIQY